MGKEPPVLRKDLSKKSPADELSAPWRRNEGSGQQSTEGQKWNAGERRMPPVQLPVLIQCTSIYNTVIVVSFW